MIDKPSPQRSALMARVRQTGTAAEMEVGEALRALGVRYRRNVKSLAGSPDFANRSRGWAVFVHGYFWHRHHGCVKTTTPKTNRTFWQEKFAANQERDSRATKTLRAAGFRVVVIWECQTADKKKLSAKLSKVFEAR